jgi:hypothetical protein
VEIGSSYSNRLIQPLRGKQAAIRNVRLGMRESTYFFRFETEAPYETLMLDRLKTRETSQAMIRPVLGDEILQGAWDVADGVRHAETSPNVLGPTSITNLAYTWKSQGRDEDAAGLMRQAERLRSARP